MADSDSARADGGPTPVPDTFTLTDWPRNCWYAAAYDVELGSRLLPRRVAGAGIVMYRHAPAPSELKTRP